MKLNFSDLRKLQTNLLLSALLLFVGFCFLSWAWLEKIGAEKNWHSAQTEVRTMSDKLQHAQGEENEINQKAKLLADLHQRGLIGEEKRLEWAELLSAIEQQYKLLKMNYEFAPQREISETLVDARTHRFFASAMSLRLHLLHEHDLLNFLDSLRKQARALIQIKHCQLSRITEEQNGAAQLQADCLIDWITIKSQGAEIEQG